jgi:hypothetical protein
MPNKLLLRQAFDQAVLDLNSLRNTGLLSGPWYHSTGSYTFEAGYRALQDQLGGQDNADQLYPTVRVISSPVGSGKTSFAVAFIAACVRTSPDIGCVLVLDQIEKCEEKYQELNALIPGRVALWTTEHNIHTQRDLARHQVAIVTHKHYGGKRSQNAKHWYSAFGLVPRTLTVVDERIQTMHRVDIKQTDTAEVYHRVVADNNPKSAEAAKHLHNLLRFMTDGAKLGDRNLETPITGGAAWSAARDCRWFNTEEAKEYMERPPAGACRDEHWAADQSQLEAVFEFGLALAMNYAFVCRKKGSADDTGETTHFIGYRHKFALPWGSLVLDATAAIDGVTRLCSDWERLEPVNDAQYHNLIVRHTPSIHTGKLKNYIQSPKNRKLFVRWMEQVITKYVRPGAKALIICRKDLLDSYGDVPKQEGSEVFHWNVNDRLCATLNWGAGVGSNTYREATTVLCFDEFYLPKDAAICTAQGLRGHEATEGDLSEMKTLNSKAAAVDLIWDGWLDKHLKQMALRGSARIIDDQGACAPQTLIITTHRPGLKKRMQRLFPGCKFITDPPLGNSEGIASGAMPKHRRQRKDTGRRPMLDQVVEWLSTVPEGVTRVGLNDAAKRLKMQPRDLSKNIGRTLERLVEALARIGWRYVSNKGCKGSWFERVLAPEPLSSFADSGPAADLRKYPQASRFRPRTPFGQIPSKAL